MKSLKSALDILNCFTLDNHELGVSEIARELGIYKSKVSRVLSAYEAEGVVLRSQSTQKYRLGPKILGWAAILLSKTDMRAVALPYMEELRGKTNETVNLYVLESDYRICIERVESSQSIRMVSKIGERLTLHAGAAGKLLLAYLPEEERKETIERIELPRLTPKTITSRKELEKELEKICRQGFATSFQELVPLAASISAPLRNYEGEVIAALGIAGPAMRFTSQKVKEYLLYVKEIASKISQELGYQA